MHCQFIQELNKLQVISAESVDHADRFDNLDDFKQYLHIERPVETILKSKLRQLRESSKCLLLLCGNAGDGKSHLLSYLKSCDSEAPLEGFELYNDATESSAPDLTAIETLAQRLKAFRDDDLEHDDRKKLILAINLGLLNSFIESESGKQYRQLRSYVYHNRILHDRSDSAPSVSNVFHHVSFSDYQMFSLSSEGARSFCLEELFSRVFDKDEAGRNRFYNKFLECSNCTLHTRCPVRHNYAFLGDSQIQKGVIAKMIASMLKDKTIITMREVLDFIYHILVHHSFNKEFLQDSTSQWIAFLHAYLPNTTPMLLFEYNDVSPLIDVIQRQDVLKTRSDENDASTLNFYAVGDVTSVVDQAVDGTPYQFIAAKEYLWSNIEIDRGNLRNIAFKFVTRLKDITQIATGNDDLYLRNYIRLLHMLNTGQGQPKELTDLVRRGVYAWRGNFGERRICIDDTNEKYYLLEELELKIEPVFTHNNTEREISRFSPVLRVRLSKRTDPGRNVVIDIDYSLYKLLHQMTHGYRPTIQDKNIYTDFASAINALTEYGQKRERITLYPKSDISTYEVEIEASDYNFDFKVVRH